MKQLVLILRNKLRAGASCAVYSLYPDGRAVKVILRLNGEGRRYLIEDGSSRSKSVKVLNDVSYDINCVFLQLLENLGLCNRRASVTTIGKRRPGANLDQPSSSGKRARASSAGKEPGRRLA